MLFVAFKIGKISFKMNSIIKLLFKREWILRVQHLIYRSVIHKLKFLSLNLFTFLLFYITLSVIDRFYFINKNLFNYSMKKRIKQESNELITNVSTFTSFSKCISKNIPLYILNVVKLHTNK